MTDDNDGVSTTSASRNSINPNEMANDYLPGEDQWVAKTILDLEDPGRIAVLRQMDQIYPEVEDLQPVIDQFLDEFLPAKTSIGGKSRDEINKMFQAMFGSDVGESDSGAQLAAALGVDTGDD